MVALKKCQCDTCRTFLSTEVSLDNPNELLILHHTYATKEGLSHLTAPSPPMVKATEDILLVFQQYYNKLKHNYHIKRSLLDLARSAVNRNQRE